MDECEDVSAFKDEFRRLIIESYHDVEVLLKLEDEIQQMRNVPQKADEVVDLRRRHVALQKEIDAKISQGLINRSLILDEYKRRKSNDCGHPDRPMTEPCGKCIETKNNAKAFKGRSIEKWLSDIIPQNELTALIFYRGTWCGNCAIYLREIDQIVPKIRLLGGEVYGICSQSKKYVDEMRKDTKVKFELISNKKNTLAKKFDIHITHKNEKAFKTMSRIIKSALGTSESYDPYHEDGVIQPAVVIINRQGEVVYVRTSPVTIDVGYGMFDRVPATDVLEAIRCSQEKNETNRNIVVRKQSVM
ncbi:alkyl hydroperoxide reductase subunit C [Acrasis kona]|uniref:Alkyl hydroperoxide reductase subunit C n=1 Tax=Acrasis kona TaxID=1008807 RepID=A0AAW2ZJ77_9EUKA